MTAKEVLQRICKDNNLTFRKLASVTGLPEQYIYDINNGKIKKITAQKVGAFTRAFPNYPAMWIMTGDDIFLPTTPTTSSVIITNTHSGDSVHTGNIIKGDHNNVGVPASATIQEYQRIIEEKDKLIATLQSQIDELKADKENLMQLLTNLTAKL